MFFNFLHPFFHLTYCDNNTVLTKNTIVLYVINIKPHVNDL